MSCSPDYDAQHRIVSITDPRNLTYLTNEYDAAGRVVRQTQADGGVFTFRVVSATNPAFSNSFQFTGPGQRLAHVRSKAA